MRDKAGNRTLGVVLLAALTITVIFWPQKFSDYAHTDRTEARFMLVIAWDSGARRQYANGEIQPEEMERILSLLNDGRLYCQGFWRTITYPGDEILYSVTLGHESQGGYVTDARFELLSDGSLYDVWYNVGYIRYRLTGCDMEAVTAALDALLDIG